MPEFGQDSRKLAVIYFKLAGDRIGPLALNIYKTVLTVPLLLLLGIPLVPIAMPARDWLAIGASGMLLAPLWEKGSRGFAFAVPFWAT